MPGTLYVVATPIGNLEDITLRALRTLREVALIAAEDTRRTAKLLSHYSISTQTTSVREHNERRKAGMILDRLRGGDDVALVSDAGTPSVSDPGSRLVRAVLEEGLKVVAIPGPSAVLAALVSSGFDGDEFVFAGFPPARLKAREEWLRRLAADRRTLVFFEAPHRIRATLEEAQHYFGNRPIAIARELTKLHEQLVVQPINEILAALWEPRGEYTIVVSPGALDVPLESGAPSERQLLDEFGHITENNPTSRREAVRTLAKRYGLSPREVYRLLERAKSSVS
jgi:16S rRNA (cytidine1402-2'-O)-methyltransferase